MNDNIIMENIYFNSLLKRPDVSVQLDDIYTIDNDIKDEGSGTLPIQCATEESKLLVVKFLKEKKKYFSEYGDTIMLLLEEHDVKPLSQFHVEIKDESDEDDKDESEDESKDDKDESEDESKDDKDESDEDESDEDDKDESEDESKDDKDESDEDESDEDDKDESDEDDEDESDEDVKCDDGCNCINCTTINYDICDVKCKCINCINLNH
jgi:hypothetical protein